IEALGHAVDRDLVASDVRLTMGGEPTFVSADDPDGAEWNFEALGERKRLLAGDLLRRLERRFAPGAFLHFGQGKWYPGEQLPRVFELGLGSVVGYALPLSPEGSRRWKSGKFFLRSEALFLVPGDSAMGFRLPLASLPWAEKGEMPVHIERDPFETLGPLPP